MNAKYFSALTILVSGPLASCSDSSLVGGAVGSSADSADTEFSESPTLSVLATGAALHGANGIRFDADDRLHVASVFGREIAVLDRETGEVLDRLGRESGVDGPDDLAFGADGSLFWTSIVTGEVGRRYPDGTVSIVAQLPPGANPIAMRSDGRLLVGLCFLGDGLFEVDPEGSEPPRALARDLGGNCGFNAFDFGPDGFLYAPGFFRDEIVRVDIDTAEMRRVASGFGIPNALKFDSLGRLHQVDTQRGELWRVDVSTGEKALVAHVPPNTDNLAFDSTDRLFVSAADSGQIAEVRSDGSLRVVSPGGITRPGGVASVGDSLYVADHFSLLELDANTGEERSRVTSVIGVSELEEPLTVSADGDRLILSSYFANAVQVWSPRERRAVASYHDFEIPLNAVAFRGGLAVAELGRGRVAWQPAPSDERETLLSGLAVPTGLAADGGVLYVADWGRGTVTRVDEGGHSEVIASGLEGPEGLALTPAGSLLIVEASAGRLSRLDLKDRGLETLREGLALGAPAIETDRLPPTWFFNGVSVDARGHIFVSGDVDRVVYRLEN